VVNAYKPSTQEVEAGKSQVQGHSGLHRETLSQKKKKKRKEQKKKKKPKPVSLFIHCQ
jgi:hypothetical protein